MIWLLSSSDRPAARPALAWQAESDPAAPIVARQDDNLVLGGLEYSAPPGVFPERRQSLFSLAVANGKSGL
jgi:hypothetical protein